MPCQSDEKKAEKVAVDPKAIRQASDRYGRRLEIMIARKNWEGAREIIEEARRTAQCDEAPPPLLEVPLALTEIPLRAVDSLENSLGVLLVGDLAKVTAGQMLAIPNFGALTLSTVWWSVLKLAASRDAAREDATLELQELRRYRENSAL